MHNLKKQIIQKLRGDTKLLEYEINSFVKNKQKEEIENYYCIITSVYNVEKYLEEYFNSIIKQSLEFEKYIYIVLIDDGSTDTSNEIIKKWKKEFNNNISLLTIENHGQAYARNLALEHLVKSSFPWVTFIDADDTINNIYFEKVHKFLDQNENIQMLSCNQVFYIEETQKEKKHYLSYRFKETQNVVNPMFMKGFIQSTASSVFFQTSLLAKHNLYFDSKVKPLFEDGHFVNKLLIAEPHINIAFLQQPTYYWRKRLDNTSTMDSAWTNVKRFSDAIEYGLLTLVISSKKKYGYVPIYLQRFVLYHISWYFNKIIFQNFSLEFLTKEQLNKFQDLLKEIFTYIDIDIIKKCKLGAMYHKIKLGMLKLYKNIEELESQVYYIDDYDPQHNCITIRFYHYKQNSYEEFKLNDNIIPFKFLETNKLSFFENEFIYETRISIDIKGDWEYLNLQSDTKNIYFSLNKKWYKDSIQIHTIKNIKGVK